MSKRRKAARWMFANNKGGVGKTSTALNEAAALSEKGYSVIFVDMDDSTNSTFHIKAKGSNEKAFPISSFLQNPGIEIQDCILWDTKLENVGLIPSDQGIKRALEKVARGSDEEILKIALRLKAALDQLDGDVDFIIIDASPTMDAAVKIAMSVATHVVFVIDGSAYAEQGIINMMNSEDMKFVRQHNEELKIVGVLPNKIDMRVNVSQNRVNAETCGGIPTLQVYIPSRVEVDGNTYTHEFAVGPNKTSLLAESYRDLANLMIEVTKDLEITEEQEVA